MKAIVFHEANRLSVQECPPPRINAHEALVKVHACGICGTDIHILHGEHIVKFPVIPGHEFSGEIVEVGSDVRNVKVGDRVTVDPNIVDNTCFFCRRGEVQLCENLTAVGVNYDGGFAQFCKVPAVQAVPIPNEVSLDEAAMAEPLACCVHGIDRANIVPGCTVVLLGAGSIGLMLLQLAKASGAGLVIVSEPDDRKRELAARFGAEVLLDPTTDDAPAEVMKVTGVGADIVIESAGRMETAQLAVKLARRGGTVLQFGVVSPDKLVSIAPYDVFYKELTIRGSFVNPFTHARAVGLLARKQIDVMPLVTHRFSLDDAAKALETAQSRDAVKVLFTPNG